MHYFVSAVFVALFAATNAGVLIAPAISQYPAVYKYQPVYQAPIVSKSIYSAPFETVQTDESLVNGRTGTIHTKKVSAQPAVAANASLVHEPVLSYAPAVAHQYVAPQYVAPQYVAPAIVSKGVKYVQSAVGWVPEGSGLEGQYVDDQRERLFDDGSYRLEHH